MDTNWVKVIALCVYGIVLTARFSAGATCSDCNVFGVYYPPNQPFDYRRECLEMTGCYCFCDANGSSRFRCDKERNTCDRTVSSSRDFYNSRRSSSYYSSSSSTSSGSSGGGSGAIIKDVKSDGCTSKCVVNGKQIDGGTYFNHEDGCLSYSSCYCGCDGNWQCPASNAVNTCTGSGGGQLAAVDNSGCRPCVIDGTQYKPDAPFTYRNNCIEWSDCRCRCDGSWNCASNSGKWVCDNVCRECEVGDKRYPGRSTFTHRTDCIVYDPCTCNCDGSWDCPAKNGKWVCTDQCLECSVNGNKYPGRSTFSLREDCWEWNPCNCNCDGSWDCPREHAKWVCTEQCLECDVNGQKYQGNTQFQYVDGCYEYNCKCKCDGGWSCPANRTRDLCRLNMQTGCYNCVVNGQQFQGNNLFTYEESCIRYDQCICNCDGSWECPGDRATNICRRNETTGCNRCDVYGQTVQGNSKFELQQDCWNFDCDCDCNGNWRCHETGAQYVCGSQLLDTSGCKSCLAEGTRYASQSSFEINWGCISFQCSCNCDGSWICPSRLAKNTCSDAHFQKFLISSITNLPNSWCTECTIGGSVYPGYSQFEYQQKCTRQYARCYCNGGYRFDSSIITGCSGDIEFSVSRGNCINCKFNDQTYAALSEFELSSQCKRYKCKCECNGRPSCQAVSENVCGSSLTVVQSQIVREGGTETIVVPGGTETRTVVVSGGGGGSGTVVSGSGGTSTRTVVVSGSGGGGSTETTRTVVVSGNGGSGGSVVVPVGGTRTTTTTKETRVVVTGGGGTSTTGSRTVVTGGGGTSTGQTVVRVGGSGQTAGTTAVIGTDGSICYHCVGLDGKRYPGNSEFKFRRGCAVWKCQCNCFGRAVCRPDDLSACLVEQQCRHCVVDGRTYQTNRMFSYEKDCVIHQCRCTCDGTPRCVQTVAPDCQKRDTTCKECIVGGERHQPNTLFDIETRCRKQRCQCDCNGQYRCSRPQNLCAYGTETTQEDTCEPCELDGQTYAVDSSFTVDRGCYRMSCSCSCKDRLTCDQSKTVDICEKGGERCQACEVDGERYSPNAKFEREVGCQQKRCYCRCDGNYDCVNTGVNLCEDDDDKTKTTDTTRTSGGSSVTHTTTTDTRGGSSVTSTTTENKDCQKCIADRIERRIGVPFCLERGCKRYTCQCYCNGRYACQTDKPINICDENDKVVAAPCDTAAVTSTESTGSQTSSTQTSGGSQTITRTETRTQVNTTTTTGGGSSVETSSQYFTEYEDRRGGVPVSSADRRGRCMQCNIQEQYYNGNSDFQLDLGCKRFRCRCDCDGSWSCPRQRPANICNNQEKCRPCRLRGEVYPPNNRFTIDIDNCRKYQCTCSCAGEYSCPREDIVNTCETQCKACQVKGNSYNPNTQFSYDEDCFRYRCDCNCDGSWDCPSSRTEKICDLNPKPSVCSECEVKGQRYRGNSRFSYDEDCFRYNCDCNCDGSWNCPKDRTQRICESGGQTGQSGQCRQCEVKGQRYRGNSRFSYDEDCVRYNCDCNCDGSWECPASRSERICNTQPSQCRECEVKGRKYRGNSRFSYDEDCFRFNCECNCDGSWNCPSSRTQNICESGQTSITNSGCRECEVKGRRYRGNSRFAYDDGCYRFNCDCNCDGSWNCPSSRTQDICRTGQGQRTVVSETTETTSEDSGSSRITTGTGCRECEVKGRRYRGNSRFSYDDDCFRFNCDCNCDGSWNCPSSRTENICGQGERTGESRTTVTTVESSRTTSTGTGCRECEVKGRRYAGRTRFSYDDGCYRFNCDCNCDGSWNCPSSRTENICGQGERTGESRTTVTTIESSRTTSTGTGCRECEVKGRRYAGRTRFSYDDGCYRFNCDCNCDGSYNCPSSRTQNLCGSGQSVGSGSRTTITTSTSTSGSGGSDVGRTRIGSSINSGVSLSESRRTGGGSSRAEKTVTETHTSTSSQSSSSKTVVGGSQTTTELRSRSGSTTGAAVDSYGCHYCIVNDVQHRGRSNFQFEDNCFRFSCECRCDGSWVCPAERTVNICPDKCSECNVNGKSYPPNTIFEYDENCFRFNCDCACDGSFVCPAERTKDICGGRSDTCKECVVNGRRYQPNRQFQYDELCNRFTCDCNCDGSYRCPSERTQNICGALRADTCQECRVNGKSYEPKKQFTYIDGCNLRRCTCDCSGRHRCISSTDICQSSGQVCRDCLVKEKRYVPNQPFKYTEGCDRFNCDCNCDGSWTCPAERTENLCEIGQCQKCSVRGDEKEGNSGFVVTENCRQYKCWCHCDGNWSCSKDFTRVCNLG